MHRRFLKSVIHKKQKRKFPNISVARRISLERNDSILLMKHFKDGWLVLRYWSETTADFKSADGYKNYPIKIYQEKYRSSRTCILMWSGILMAYPKNGIKRNYHIRAIINESGDVL